jgi:sensor c-di-GMP phosphodiesterase-like protein
MGEMTFEQVSIGEDGAAMPKRETQRAAQGVAAADIAAAMAESRLRVHYMPTIEISTGCCVGAEALLRWPVADGGFVAPDDFIPLAEAAGLAGDLTAYVLRCVAADLGALLRARRDLHISVNVPPPTVGSGVGNRVAKETGLDDIKGQFIAEITERQALTKAGQVLMNESRREGLRVAVDDFGTGHSGLAQLIDLEVDYLKIDRSFVDALKTARGEKLMRATWAAADVLGVELIAEGVETARQAEILADIGIAFGQGWFWSRDLPAEAFRRFVAGKDLPASTPA